MAESGLYLHDVIVNAEAVSEGPLQSTNHSYFQVGSFSLVLARLYRKICPTIRWIMDNQHPVQIHVSSKPLPRQSNMHTTYQSIWLRLSTVWFWSPLFLPSNFSLANLFVFIIHMCWRRRFAISARWKVRIALEPHALSISLSLLICLFRALYWFAIFVICLSNVVYERVFWCCNRLLEKSF